MIEFTVVPCIIHRSHSPAGFNIRVDDNILIEDGKVFCSTEAEALEKVAELQDNALGDALLGAMTSTDVPAAPPRPQTGTKDEWKHLSQVVDAIDAAAIEQARPQTQSFLDTVIKTAEDLSGISSLKGTAAAEPALERTPPQDDTASICSQFYDRWERPGIPFYDFLQFAKKLRAVAVPEPAAQQESARKPSQQTNEALPLNE